MLHYWYKHWKKKQAFSGGCPSGWEKETTFWASAWFTDSNSVTSFCLCKMSAKGIWTSTAELKAASGIWEVPSCKKEQHALIKELGLRNLLTLKAQWQLLYQPGISYRQFHVLVLFGWLFALQGQILFTLPHKAEWCMVSMQLHLN